MRVIPPKGCGNISVGGFEIKSVGGVIDVPDHHAQQLIEHHGFTEAKDFNQPKARPEKAPLEIVKADAAPEKATEVFDATADDTGLSTGPSLKK